MSVHTSELAGTVFSTIVDDEQLTYLAERFIPRTYAIGAIIVRAGQNVQRMHVIRKGRVSLYTENDAGDRVMLREFTDGEQFGELALLDGSPSPFTAMAVEESQILDLDRDDFEVLIARYPRIGRELLKTLSNQLREVMETLRIQSTSDIDDHLNQTGSEAMSLTRLISGLPDSWVFFAVLGVIEVLWMFLGRGISWPIYIRPFDPYPYSLLLVALSTVAVIQLHIILMVGIRIRQKRLKREKHDLDNEARLQVQIASLHAKIDASHPSIDDQVDSERVARLESEIARLRSSLEEQRGMFEEKLARVSRAIRVGS